jgi:hypothetical protein
MKIHPLGLLMALILLTSAVVSADDVPTPSENQTPTTPNTPTPLPTSTPPKSENGQNFSKALVIHKPRPSPSWGKVVQYHRDQILALSEKNRETLHEFVFQDENGIVRTAIFHENASGDGYWEVWVWDQP